MSNPNRPGIKLKLSTSSNAPSPPPLDTTVTSTPKIRLKIGSGNSKPVAPAEAPDATEKKEKKEKKPRKPKPKKEKPATNGTLSVSNPKKRAQAEEDEDHEGVSEIAEHQVKKLKLNHRAPPITPILRVKSKGKPPPRPLGCGYDSEASDREDDPAIEEEFVLRMEPGDDCDYLRRAIEEKRIGVPVSQGGADVRMKFLSKDGRRAMVTIRQRHYAATLVDLPCIVEGMKSWDKKGWWKTADICQMLLVIGRVPNEQEALTVALPGTVDPKTFQYPHGLTPPMHHVRKRRFRKRVSNRTIEAVEEEVERLLQADIDCVAGSSKYEVLDLDRLTRETSQVQSDDAEGYELEESEYGYQDAEGEVDLNAYYDDAENDEEAGLEADLERAFMGDNPENGDVAPDSAVSLAPTETVLSGTPATTSAAEDSGDDPSDEEEVDEPDEIDEELLERQQELLRHREEIADLESAIKSQTAEFEKVTNIILKQKLSKKIASLRADLNVKKKAIGEGGEE
ncbi:MAG: hypothetical protein M1836_001365 [Candelina mexicana]|nr:MAG: hypothetical protein M1836_001365 [Candelina mexicana]